MKKRFGFTLAEVLITLGIIGVVSMMVLPTIKGETEKIVTMAQLKHSYSTLQNAIRMSEYHNGKAKRWQFDNTMTGKKFFEKYIKNYIKYTQAFDSTQLKDQVPRKLLNGHKYNGSTYGTKNGGVYHILLLNGSMVSFNLVNSGRQENGWWVGIDVNGINAPNTIGKDTFLFYFSPQFGLQPFGGPGTPASSQWNYMEYVNEKNTVRDVLTDSKYSTSCSRDAADLWSNYSQTGYWCTALIMNDGWKISKDYPWSKVKKHQKEKKH